MKYFEGYTFEDRENNIACLLAVVSAVGIVIHKTITVLS